MIRYPGSKDKITKAIRRHFPSSVADPLFQPKVVEYREPFFGAGAVGLDLLRRLPRRAAVWLNDKDYGMACLWKAVQSDHELLIEKIDRFTPSTDAFYRFKEEDGRTDLDPVELGFRKFALHRISFSGLGVKAGGPIGGRKQSSAFNVGCRWNPSRHCLQVKENHRLFNRFARLTITSGDFERLIIGAPPYAFIYADPPYYEKGPQLYKHAMSDDDHRRLAKALRECQSAWVLSYDDHTFVRSLYGWAAIDTVALKYTTAVAHEARRKNQEIIIVPRRLSETRAA